MKLCLYCNQPFEPKNPKGKFCSDNHRRYWHNKNGKPTQQTVAIKPEQVIIKPVMPKGLSLAEQLEWRTTH